MIPHVGAPAVCFALDATTGNELFHVELFKIGRETGGQLEPVDTALGALELVVAAAGRVTAVDVRRGEIAWSRTGLDSGRLSSVGAERVVLAAPSGLGPGLELDLTTGRRLAAIVEAPARPRSGSIEIK